MKRSRHLRQHLYLIVIVLLTRVTQSVPNQVFAGKNGPLRLRQGGIGHLFAENVAQSATFSAKSYNMHHAAAGDSGFRFRHRARTGPTA